MKNYYVIYGDFANTYKVYSAEKAETKAALLERGAEKITRKKAVELCNAEKDRRQYGGNGGFATAAIIDAEETI